MAHPHSAEGARQIATRRTGTRSPRDDRRRRSVHRPGNLPRRVLGPVPLPGLGPQDCERPDFPQAGAMEPGSPAGMTVSQDSGHTAPPGSSSEQRDAERIMLDFLGQDLGLSLEPARIALPSDARIEVDGTDAGRTVLVECWAHRGPRNQRSATKASPTPSS